MTPIPTDIPRDIFVPFGMTIRHVNTTDPDMTAESLRAWVVREVNKTHILDTEA